MRLLAFAQVELGITESEFWHLTPAKLTAFIDQKKAQIEREDYRSGWLAYVVRSIMGDKKAHPMDGFRAQSKKAQEATTAQEVRANFQALIEMQEKKRKK